MIELKLTNDEIDVMIDLINHNAYFHDNPKLFNVLSKLKDVINKENDEIKTCPFCGRLPEPELYMHNSTKPDSWYIYCDCGKVHIEDCDTMEESLLEWCKRV